MSESEKVRVVAPMPKLKKSLYLSIIPLVLLLAFVVYQVIAYWHAPSIAEPMNGACTNAPLKRYESGDRDGKNCIWRNARFWCVYDPSKNAWSCDLMEQLPAPAEAVK